MFSYIVFTWFKNKLFHFDYKVNRKQKFMSIKNEKTTPRKTLSTVYILDNK